MRLNISKTTPEERAILEKTQGIHLSNSNGVWYVEFSRRYFEESNQDFILLSDRNKIYKIRKQKVIFPS